MIFEWHDEKRLANLERHFLDFVDARLLFDGRPVATYPSPRGDEARLVTIGQIGARCYAVVWVQRGQTVRLISFRRARDAEERRYHALVR